MRRAAHALASLDSTAQCRWDPRPVMPYGLVRTPSTQQRPEKISWDDLSNSGPAVRLYSEGRATGPPEDRYRRSHDTVFGGYLPPQELRPDGVRGRSDGPRNRRAQRRDEGCWCQGFCWRPATGKQREIAAVAARR